MHNFEEIMDIVCQTISERKQGDVFFSIMDLTYAYGQLPLSENPSKHCNFFWWEVAPPVRIVSRRDSMG